ncbi:MAG: hypothetical protein ACKOKC_09080 [Chthoniobacterales bacterium]
MFLPPTLVGTMYGMSGRMAERKVSKMVTGKPHFQDNSGM